MAKEASIHVRLDAATREALEAAAEADGRKLSNLVERILTEWVKTKPKRTR